MVTLYEKNGGRPVIFAHVVDAKESLQTGFYIKEDPRRILVVDELPEPKPIKIPEPVVRTKEPVVAKPIEKKSSRIIKK
jgi:hypothetical protein